MLYLAIRIHKTGILPVTIFTSLQRITRSFENVISQHALLKMLYQYNV